LRIVDGEPRALAAGADDDPRQPSPRTAAATARTEAARADEDAVRSHPRVQAVLEIFATDIESIETIPIEGGGPIEDGGPNGDGGDDASD
jgi:hypothetical protein